MVENKTSSTFCEIISEKLKDKLVEIFVGEMYETLHQADFSYNSPMIICGRLVDGVGDCLILDSFHLNEDHKREFGNIIYINGYNIKAITELNTNGTLKEVLTNSTFYKKVKK